MSESANMWTPNLFPDNLVDMTLMSEHSGIWHRYDGRMWWARQMRWTLACAMDFELMPFGTPSCFVVPRSAA